MIKKLIELAFAPVLIVLFMVGCTTTQHVQLTSAPSGASVKVSADQRGMQDFTVGETPITHSFIFGTSAQHGPTMYNVEFSKSGFETKTIILRGTDKRDALHAVLEKELVREVSQIYLEISEDRGYVPRTRRVRAWVEDIEREGMAASSIVRLSDHQWVQGLTMSPDGHTLYFSLVEEVIDQRGRRRTMSNIRSVRADGGGITEVTSGQWLDVNPACSPDGKHLLFDSTRFSARPDLYRISTEKTGGIAVIRQASDASNYRPTVANNGLVVYTFTPRRGTTQIWSLGGENHYPTQLRAGKMPSVSPAGDMIAFIGDDRQLWVMPTTAQNPIQLTFEEHNIRGKENPSWSPDGQHIVFASDVGRDSQDVPNYGIWIIAADGTGLRQLTTNGSEDNYPIVSPDGRFIYFVSNRGFRQGIWRMPFPTTRRRR